MAGFFEFLAANEVTLIICLLGIILILIIAIIIVDIVGKKRRNILDKDVDLEEDLDITNIKINNDGLGMIADETALEKIDVEAVTKNLERTQEIEEIKYVEEDEEQEKTKALLELENLKKELAKMEQEEYLETPQTEVKEEKQEEIKPEVVKVNKKTDIPEVETIKEEVIVEEDVKTPSIEEEVEAFESSQEEHAIISVEELMKASENITEEEIEAYEDDGNEPISIKELEALYKSVEEPVKVEVKEEKTKLPEFDIKVKPASEAYEGKSFKNSSVISPVFGVKTNEESIMLEQTANLDKLNEEIRKTNEFLSMLKELRKNLD